MKHLVSNRQRHRPPTARRGSAEALRRSVKAARTRAGRSRIRRNFTSNPVSLGAKQFPGLSSLIGGKPQWGELALDAVYLTAGGFAGNWVGTQANRLAKEYVFSQMEATQGEKFRAIAEPVIRGGAPIALGLALDKFVLGRMGGKGGEVLRRLNGAMMLASGVIAILELGAASTDLGPAVPTPFVPAALADRRRLAFRAEAF